MPDFVPFVRTIQGPGGGVFGGNLKKGRPRTANPGKVFELIQQGPPKALATTIIRYDQCQQLRLVRSNAAKRKAVRPAMVESKETRGIGKRRLECRRCPPLRS